MIEVLIVLLIVWVVVTLIGHGSWVVTRAIWNSLFGDNPSSLRKVPTNLPASRTTYSPQSESVANVQPASPSASDFAAFQRGLDRLLASGQITKAEAARLWESLDRLHSASKPLDPIRTAVSTPPVFQQQPVVASRVLPATTVGEPAPRPRPDQLPASEAAGNLDPLIEYGSVVEPIEEQTSPALSSAEVILSVLAAHNIRWGELVAGTLIVVCSIGLVVSLWSTMTQTHRVIPSLIFLGGNASIFAAGLYTLSRWRLRHTSRAVLVIATLLVPLSILAGLAAAGSSSQAIDLTDPMTLTAIVVGAVIYGLLLVRGGRALVGRFHAWTLASSVAASSVMLPLMPATIRWLGEDAGWVVGLAAISLAASIVADIRLHRRPAVMLGTAQGRNRCLTVAVGMFAYASLVGYAAFLLRDVGNTAWLSISLASIPAAVAVSAVCETISHRTGRGTTAVATTVVAILAMIAAWLMLIPTLVGPGWVWVWGCLLTASGLAVWQLLRRPIWFAISTVPLALAAILTSPLWLGGFAWPELPLWRRLIGGEPMVVAALASVIAAGVSRVVRDRDQRQWLGIVSGGWAVVAVAIASALAFGPATWLGTIPSWVPTLVLLTAFVAAAAYSLYDWRWTQPATLTLTLSWISSVRPDGMVWPPSMTSVLAWMYVWLGISISLLILGVVARRSIRIAWFRPRAASRAIAEWTNSAVFASGLACGLAVVGLWTDWSRSAIGLGIASIALLWASVGRRSATRVGMSQAASFAAITIAACGWLNDPLMTRASWSSGVALWSWCIVIAVLPVPWFLLREARLAGVLGLDRSLRYLGPLRFWGPASLDATAALSAAGWLLATSSIWFLGLLVDLFSAADELWFSRDVRLSQKSLASVTVAAAVLWWGRLEGGWKRVSVLMPIVGLLISIWVIVELVCSSTQDPVWRLIAATCLLLVTCGIVVWRIELSLEDAEERLLTNSAIVFGALVLVIASVGLLASGWVQPLLAGKLAEPRSTWAVAIWWLIVAVGLLAMERRWRPEFGHSLSAILVPLAIAILVPSLQSVPPVVWIQAASIGTAGWLVLRGCLNRGDEVEPTEIRKTASAVIGSRFFLRLVGIGTALMVTVSILRGNLIGTTPIGSVIGPTGAIASLLAVLTWTPLGWLPATWRRLGSDVGLIAVETAERRKSWVLTPWIGLSALGGQIAWLAVWVLEVVLEVSVRDASWIVLVVWCAAAIGSVIRFRRVGTEMDYWHAATATFLVPLIAWATWGPVAWRFSGTLRSEPMVAIVLLALAIGGTLIAIASRQNRIEQQTTSGGNRWSIRPIGWFVLLVGAASIPTWLDGLTSDPIAWTLVATWLAGWITAWRLACPDRGELDEPRQSMLPDMEASWLLLAIVIGDAFRVAAETISTASYAPYSDLSFGGRVLCVLVVAIATPLRRQRSQAWFLSLTMLGLSAATLAGRLAIGWEAEWPVRLAAMSLTAGFALTVWSHWLPVIESTSTRLTCRLQGSSRSSLDALVRGTWIAVVTFSIVVALCAIGMMNQSAEPGLIRLTIAAIGLAAWSAVELAQRSQQSGLQRTAVGLGLVTMGLLASVDGGESVHPWLAGSMRWLVAATLSIPTLLFVLPRVVGRRFAEPWRDALTRGAIAASVAAVVSLATMIGLEFALRLPEVGIVGLPTTLVVGVAVTLGVLSLLAAVAAIVGWDRPDINTRSLLVIDDDRRRWLIIAAQGLGVVTWLHVYLCKPEWMFAELRDFWPLLVMSLSFASVGITEWVRRRGDRVLADTLRHTAMYLPLIPVLGFWFSGSAMEAGWRFTGGSVSYALLLSVGAAYYGLLSMLWKGTVPRVSAIVLANAAWWVVLVQAPGWQFLVHPQAWLIPPAVCVLVTAHFYRERLAPAMASAIRYGGTLVIYLSSTADMLIADIGRTLAGPMVLILLALLGMAAGVVLRVKPFLYLGSAFVFVAATSMVWHAQQAIDQTWPWWAFGITLGLCLLAGLMTLEKNRPKLRELADRLAAWER